MSDIKRYGTNTADLEHLINHSHAEQKIYPILANPITVTSSAAGWTLGNFTEIVPVDTIDAIVHLHYAVISAISANDDYVLSLYNVTTLIGTVAFVKSAGGEPSVAIPIQAPHVPANTQIQAKLACKSTNARTVDIKIVYHEGI